MHERLKERKRHATFRGERVKEKTFDRPPQKGAARAAEKETEEDARLLRKCSCVSPRGVKSR